MSPARKILVAHHATKEGKWNHQQQQEQATNNVNGLTKKPIIFGSNDLSMMKPLIPTANDLSVTKPIIPGSKICFGSMADHSCSVGVEKVYENMNIEMMMTKMHGC